MDKEIKKVLAFAYTTIALTIIVFSLSIAIAYRYEKKRYDVIEVQNQNKELIRENNELMIKINEGINEIENIEFSVEAYKNRMEQKDLEIERLNKEISELKE